ncbi:hypothetical protein GUITHDRAFT_154963 [Guillardia theta CCMP2712]|uniref:Uncharacterized protein n=1 Tax=Guillardia theta (strain CCMP2712) TaxID=905079 RepID=L1IMB1_GUITC|nr:hypothetical protein GUITHDRAFT_154963 [Guillardia theta CCMP2712]EKX37413.1 hypothetical protein GUITHDRAFT_154963 [Guillardia theta CCMP2712]|mmetsp:Transcript_43835/g.138454  ORF Transcript_43835/g.138454 Transcript_43835/m.138454 type:complete len:180 (-) Transcript_43835:141-680(-)|eukprot:XP_005824393.1 hypothetical protein GUITHDRAFT_154963 [Guillardia theta CCMP2712]
MLHISEEERQSVSKVNEWLKSEQQEFPNPVYPSMESSKRSSSKHLGTIFQLMEEAESETAPKFDFLAISPEEHSDSEATLSSLLGRTLSWTGNSARGSQYSVDIATQHGKMSSLDLTGMLGVAVEGLLLGTSVGNAEEECERGSKADEHEWEAKAKQASCRARRMGMTGRAHTGYIYTM